MIGDEDGFVPLSSVDPSLTTVQDALPLAAAGELPTPALASSSPVSAAHLALAAPLERPGKLWGIGLNYADHASDLNEDSPTEPASFMKPATAATGPGGPIRLPSREISDRVTAEAELAVVIGRTCSDVAEADVDDVVAGYVPVIDMTAEDILERNPRFLTRSKSFDSFLVFGSELVTTDEVGALDDLSVRTVVNEEVAAENRIRNMMTPPRELVSFHSEVMTLEPGDVISTGTPGAKHIVPGDNVRAEVERVGTATANVVR
ncbi:2-keto-4-pentenoate hydratase/2-oxohepta-3-ene-1,7-dioic acid hydratase (catechol pathway) [Halogranum amylolyticum]|uniref:2-keto-4-pentenoate hydratase/2-oxohepta-3-ene-1,7-dioic acid hydratase (Catechol pathway) n=2 Tax=Halogranum amylolyticum TaxID=660520 RepID=A0A1H8MU74_9EURY|nr:2-keto-4-pentenoate hydratase/2-oxohepta-3-ene-1,7-dioic acid hydratase (catechol pathway) [Halogranum amylolyticum]